MKEELTNEVLEAMTECKLDCATCCANAVCRKYDWPDALQAFATALLEERAKQKDDVWEYAPDGITTAEVHYGDDMIVSATPDHTFTREPPKTRIDEIADEVWHEINKGVTGLPKDIIKRWLKKYAEELAVGETKMVCGKTVRCEEGECWGCAFEFESFVFCETLKCTCVDRLDGLNVHYIEVSNEDGKPRYKCVQCHYCGADIYIKE